MHTRTPGHAVVFDAARGSVYRAAVFGLCLLRIRGYSFALAVTFAASASVGCAPPAPKTVSLRVDGAPANATVHIDDRYIGDFAMVKRRGVALPPGKHRITVERSGYFPWDRLVEVREGDPPLRLGVVLRKIPD